MKNRTIDLALIAGLVLVAGAIVWTLFSLGGTAPGSLPDPGPAASDGAGDPAGGGAGGSDGRGVVPVDPDGGAAGGGGVTGEGDAVGGDAGRQASPDDATTNGGVAPLAPGDAAGDGASGGEADGPPGGAVDGPVDGTVDGADAQLPAAQAPPVPESGPVDLSRIGFSFVTGGAGACGVVLEPWTHVAVSRELLEAYGCGAEVTVTLDDPTDGRTQLLATVADTMNPSFSRTVNIYVGEDEPALAYGLTTGTIAPR